MSPGSSSDSSQDHKIKLVRNSTAEFLIFTAQTGEESIEVRYEDETIWLTQKLMAQLFDVTVANINIHLKKVFETGELSPDSVIKQYLTTASDGKNYQTNFYNLDAIISVGYRVNSRRATQFRQWATSVLREFALKGYVLDKKRLENGSYLGEDYYERLLAEVREIRREARIAPLSVRRKPRVEYAGISTAHCGAGVSPASSDRCRRDARITIFHHAGKISSDHALSFASFEFEKFRLVQDRTFESDFDRMVKEMEGKKRKRGKDGE